METDNITFIVLKTRFEATHSYPEAPDEVAYLRNAHRHLFHVEVEIQVFHEDRELEFFVVKRYIDNYLNLIFARKHLGRCSCEMIAKILQDDLHKHYPITIDMIEKYGLGDQTERLINVKIFEDGEVGVYLKQCGRRSNEAANQDLCCRDNKLL